MTRTLLGCVGILLGSSVAWADTETVRLVDGSIYAGEIVEKVPGDHITLKLATGDVRRFEWSALAPVPSPVSTVATQGPLAVVQPFPQLPTRTAHVQLTADTRGTLLVRVDSVPAGAPGWPSQRESPVCYAPCSADVDANASYYITGYGITQSSRFAIPEGNAALSVRTGSAGVSLLGDWLVALGVISTITGAIAAPIAFADSKTSGLDGWEEFGLSALIGGTAFILLGIPFIVAGHTHVSLGNMDIAHRKKVRWLPNGFAF
jgi:hypothetical protein